MKHASFGVFLSIQVKFSRIVCDLEGLLLCESLGLVSLALVNDCRSDMSPVNFDSDFGFNIYFTNQEF